MDLRGAPLPKQAQDFDIQDLWLPATPAKTIPTRRALVFSPNPSYWPSNHPSGSRWLDPTVTHTAGGVQTMTPPLGVAFQNGSCSSPGLPNTPKYLNGGQVAVRAPANHASIAGDIRLHNLYMNNGNLSSFNPWSSLLSGNNYTASSVARIDTVPPLTPLMTQISRGREMPAPSNNPPLNGKVLLAASFCSRSHSDCCSFPCQKPQYGSPNTSLPNLNSMPESVISSTWNVGTMPGFPTPATADRFSKSVLDEQMPVEVIDLIDEESRDDENLLQKEVSSSQLLLDRPTNASFSNLMASFHCFSFQKPESVKEMAVLSKEFSDSLIEIENSLTEGENKDVHSNNDNKQKAKRRKHRPKVICEQKSARTPKPATPMPKAPRLATEKESTSGKRKYVRRKNTPPLDSSLDALGEIVNPESQYGAKHVRRCLKFDLEGSHVTEKRVGLMPSFQQNSEIHHVHQLCENDAIAGSTMKETLNFTEVQGPAVENSLEGIIFDLDSSACELQNDCLKILQAPVPPPNQNMGTLESNASSNAIPNAPSKAKKRVNSFNNEAYESLQKNLIYSSYVADLVSRSQSSDRLVSCLQEIHKKMRIDKEQSRMTSIASSKLPYTSLAKLVYTPSTGWNTIPVSNDPQELTDADDVALSDTEKIQTLENILSSEKTDSNVHENSALGNNLTSSNLFMDYNWKLTPVKPSGQKKDISQPSTPDKPSGYSTSQESKIYGALVQFETSKDVNKLVKAKGRGSKKKREQVPREYPMNSNSNHTWLLEQQVTYGTSALPQQINSGLNKNSCFFQGENPQVFSVDGYNISNNKISTHSSYSIGPLVPYIDPLEDIVQKLRRLSINKEGEVACTQSQNALVPFVCDGGLMVPYQGTLDLTKRKRPRAKVDLDPETNRVWNFLMGKKGGEIDEGANVDKEKWWEEERKIFHGRVDSFIARMHLVQGDRRFSQWKGSVVDSVIGVFLTQNVSDHLSSSAFMSLAAKFPLRSRHNHREPNAVKANGAMENDSVFNTSFNCNPELQRNISNHELGCQAYSVENFIKNGCHKETSNSNETLGSGTGSISVDNCKRKGSDIHETESFCHESADTVSGPAVTATCSINLETGDTRLTDEVVSSQNSVTSSENSAACQVQSSDQFRSNSVLNFENNKSLFGNISNDYGNSSFTELVQMAESSRFQKLCSHSSGKILVTESCCVNGQVGFGIENNLLGFSHIDNSKRLCQTCDSNRHTLFTYTPPVSQFSHSLNPSYSKMVGKLENTLRDDIKYHLPSTSCEITSNLSNFMCRGSKSENSAESNRLDKFLSNSTSASSIHSHVPIKMHDRQQISASETELGASQHIFCQRNLAEINLTDASSNNENLHVCSTLLGTDMKRIQRIDGHSMFKVESSPKTVRIPEHGENSMNSHANSNSNNNIQNRHYVNETVGSNLNVDAYKFQKVSSETPKKEVNLKRRAMNAKKAFDWDSLRKEACQSNPTKERRSETMDSLDYEALRCADVNVIAETIRERGMNNLLAERIKEFLNRLVREHGSIDLEWLRDVPPDKSKDFLLSVRGLGLKSTECVRLLTLHHLAFPVDTNVGRICVRLGWVPLQPLPESLQLHLLELYPVLETIQKYLWPRLCKLDQRTLYELHYQMITFGKVFCTKHKPNCNACPMRGECKHFASAFASARLALPAPEDKSIVSSTVPIASEAPALVPGPIPEIGCNSLSQEPNFLSKSEPIIEEPATPEPGCVEPSETAIEDAFYEDPEEIPTIKLNFEKFTQNLQNYMQENMEIQDGDMSMALVALTPEVASIPMPKLKNISRLRTEHQVYEIPDSHPLLEGFDQREPDDPCPYLLAIWTPGETPQSVEAPQACCNSQDTGHLCDSSTCFACNSIREAQAHKVRGTLLIPCRTAMRGSFPLNGTYFQVNEVFADHHSSRNPIDVPRDWIWNLPRRTVYFGTSIPTIFRGLTTQGVQHCFWRGFICVRGFDRVTRAPKPLYARLHFPASKGLKNNKVWAAAAAARVGE